MTPEEEQLDVQPIVDIKVQYGTDGTGRKIYRHVIVTEWEVVPDA